MNPVVMQTNRLRLREVRETDFPQVREMLIEPKQVRYVEFDATDSSARCLLDWSLTTAKERPRMAYSFALTLPPNDLLIGACSLVIRDEERHEGHLGIILNRRQQGKGLPLEAGRALLNFGFVQIGLHRMYASCDADNKASIRIIEKLGFRPTSQFVERRKEKGIWSDRLCYIMCRCDEEPICSYNLLCRKFCMEGFPSTTNATRNLSASLVSRAVNSTVFIPQREDAP